MEAVLVWWGRVAAAAPLAIAVTDWIGWVIGADRLTRIFVSWPPMVPWTAVSMAGLAVAVMLQTGHPPRARVWAGRGLAVVTCVLAATFLAEYVTDSSFGVDQVWFSDAVRASQDSWPGRPAPQTAASVVLLSLAVGLTRYDRRWVPTAWAASLTVSLALPSVVVVGYAYEALSLVRVTRSTGMGIGTAIAIALLVNATFVARLDRKPLAWLLVRPDRWALAWLIGILAGPPLLIGLSRQAFREWGLPDDASWALAISVSTVVVGMATFYLSQRQQKLLIEKELLSLERAEAEARYRLLLEAAPDALVIVGTDGRVAFANAQADRMFGYPPVHLIGCEVEILLPMRFQDRHIGHRMSFFADPTVRPMGVGMDLWGRRRDGSEFPVAISLSPLRTGDSLQVLAAIRDVTERHEYEQRLHRQHDELVEAHQQLERLARHDSLTGLVSRAEAFARLESALTCTREGGTELGVLFCDVDKFKDVNDTWGHTAGDTVLSTIADRISQCVRHGDTVGRTGGDEMLVLLPELHSLEEATRIGEKILARIAEPIRHCDNLLHATLSIGATLAVPGEAVTETTARADAAMYQAKHRGGNTVVALGS